MQLTGVICYALLSITISSVCVQAERHHELEEKKFDKRLRRRETTVLIDSFPTETIYHKPKVIYRRLSKNRYGPPKPKYGPPRPIYGPPKSTRRPGKKYKGKINAKYGYSHHKKVTNKPRYTPSVPKRVPRPKPHYGPPKKRNPHSGIFKNQEPAGFGEPPKFEDDYNPTPEFDDYRKPTLASYSINQLPTNPPANLGYGEPPVDSYGAPIKPNLHDLTYHQSHSFPETTAEDDKYQGDFASEFETWKSSLKDNDNRFAYSRKKPSYAKPSDLDADIFVTPLPKDEELILNSYSDIYNYRQNKEKNKKKKLNYINHAKIMNQPWKGKHSSKIKDEIVVGGQYAEPPARYVPKFQPSAPMGNGDDDDDEFGPVESHDPELVSSATNSPYVNYKHSNVAFSPQNLNDAFSIVD